MRVPLWVFAWILAIESVLVLALIPGGWTTHVVERESELLKSRLGSEEHRHIYAQATAWYNESLIDSGVYAAIYGHLIPSAYEVEQSGAMKSIGNGWFEWVSGRIDAVATSYFHMLTRFALLLSWAPYFLILLLPAAYDGFASWHIKRTNFDFASPVVQSYSVALLFYLSIITIGVFITPIVLEPTIVPSVMMVFCLAIGQVFGHLNKRV